MSTLKIYAQRQLTQPMGIKKGETPFPNLVNLKSNTMKNTLQSYCFLE